ncbi:MAG: hypothetical protein CVV46_08210 [Spirochaetae bacterium HGW-Spirochaetae-2]|nr:MAG: hypothetical protein CVV46_08210 [Spirochaetae bacterium HGW-Spirochaetae-2]
MAIVVEIIENPPSIILSDGKKFKIDVYDFSIVVGWPGDEVETIKIDGIKYVRNKGTNAKAKLAIQ